MRNASARTAFVCLVAMAAACSDSGDNGGTINCGPGQSCPLGFTCTATGICVRDLVPDGAAAPDGRAATADARPSSDAAAGAPDATPSSPDAGVPPALGLDANSVGFTQLAVGATSTPSVLMVTNQGQLATGALSVVLDDTTSFAIASNDCPATLAGGASCHIGLTFAPQHAGAVTTSLHVSATPGGALVASLTATGSAQVQVTGSAGGAVTSTPAGISCGGTCTATFTSAPVSLTAVPDATFVFKGWMGACSGTGACSLALDTSASTVTASFGCPAGLTACGGVCVDTKSDDANCGRCGNVCQGTASCMSSDCVITLTAVDGKTTDDMRGLWGAQRQSVWAVGGVAKTGTIDHFTGSAWGPIADTGTTNTCGFNAVWGAAASDVWLVGCGGTVEHGDGTAFTEIGKFTQNSLNGVWGAGAKDVWAVAAGAQIFHYDGKTWEASKSVASYDLYGVWGAASKDVWVVGQFDTLDHWDGAVWEPSDPAGLTPTDGFALNGVWGASSKDVWVVGGRASTVSIGTGLILHWDGASWTQFVKPGTTIARMLYSVWGGGAKDVWAVGEAGLVLHYDGNAWTPLDSGTDKNLRAVYGTSASDVWIVGLGGTFVHSP